MWDTGRMTKNCGSTQQTVFYQSSVDGQLFETITHRAPALMRSCESGEAGEARVRCGMWVRPRKAASAFCLSVHISHHHHSWMVTKTSTIFMSTCKLGHFTQGRISYINTKKCWCKGSFIPLPMLAW